MKIVFVFLIAWAAGSDPSRDQPTVSYAATPDSLEVCERQVAEAVVALRAAGKNVQAFCKEVEAGTIS